jgi:TPR repeat protein
MKLKALLLVILISFSWVNIVFADTGWVAYDKKDYSEAFRIWKSKADKGDASAQHNLGHLYHWGYGVLEDSTKGTAWISKAAFGGLARSQLFLAKESIRKALEYPWNKWMLGESKFWVEKLYNNQDDTYKEEAKELWSKYELSDYAVPDYVKEKEKKAESLFDKVKSFF